MSPTSLCVVSLVVGASATGMIDLWNLALSRLAGIPSLDYCLLGRWVGHMRHGVIRHRSIAAAARAPFECAFGWMAHYAIGIALAVAFIASSAGGWLARPTLAPAVAFGVATVVFPFFVLQPAIGLGVASAAARDPVAARLKSLATHTVYGIGLYASARVIAALVLP